MAKKQTPEPVALPMALSADDASYLAALLAQADAATKAMDSFAAYLSTKYALAAGDRVEPNGAIQRGGA